MIPPRLQEELQQLRQKNPAVLVQEADGWVMVVVPNHRLPPGYNKRHTQLLLKIPVSYDAGGRPDMFWTEADVLRADGRPPRNAEVVETILGKQWRRFSWHLAKWSPATDNLFTYLEFVNDGLGKAVR